MSFWLDKLVNKQKGGIETIIAVIILTGLVVALIIAAVLPTVEGGNDLAKTATGKMADLDITISGAEQVVD